MRAGTRLRSVAEASPLTTNYCTYIFTTPTNHYAPCPPTPHQPPCDCILSEYSYVSINLPPTDPLTNPPTIIHHRQAHNNAEVTGCLGYSRFLKLSHII